MFDCPPEAPDALAGPDVVDAVVVDVANEQVGFEGLVLEAGGDEEGAVVEVVKMPIPKLEVKDGNDAGGRGGGLSPAGGDLLPAQQPQAESMPSSSLRMPRHMASPWTLVQAEPSQWTSQYTVSRTLTRTAPSN